MMQIRPVLAPPEPGNGTVICAQCLPAIDHATRRALAELDAALSRASVDIDQRHAVQIAAGEAMNNICEHAYSALFGGAFVLVARFEEHSTLCLEFIDWGDPLPGMRLPEQDAPDPSMLAEGGYGWSLIHMLTQEVTYERSDSHNRLRLFFRQ